MYEMYVTKQNIRNIVVSYVKQQWYIMFFVILGPFSSMFLKLD